MYKNVEVDFFDYFSAFHDEERLLKIMQLAKLAINEKWGIVQEKNYLSVMSFCPFCKYANSVKKKGQNKCECCLLPTVLCNGQYEGSLIGKMIQFNFWIKVKYIPKKAYDLMFKALNELSDKGYIFSKTFSEIEKYIGKNDKNDCK